MIAKSAAPPLTVAGSLPRLKREYETNEINETSEKLGHFSLVSLISFVSYSLFSLGKEPATKSFPECLSDYRSFRVFRVFS
jgi:hypothetical protein